MPETVRRLSIEGAGYLNAFLDRSSVTATLLEASVFPVPEEVSDDASAAAGKIIVEHTNINPNKAAHIGPPHPEKRRPG